MEPLNYPWVAMLLDKLPADATALPRALLLTGRRGLGKRSTALFLAQSLLCETQRGELLPCGTCPSCLLYRAGNHPDLRMLEVGTEDETPSAETADEEVQPAKKARQHIPVHKVRALLDFATLTAHRGGAKVICIIPIEAMLPAAANGAYPPWARASSAFAIPCSFSQSNAGRRSGRPKATWKQRLRMVNSRRSG